MDIFKNKKVFNSELFTYGSVIKWGDDAYIIYECSDTILTCYDRDGEMNEIPITSVELKELMILYKREN